MTPTLTTEALLEKLQALHTEREAAISKWRSPEAQFPALFELVVARGMSTEQAGKHLSLSGEGVARRVRPVKAHFKLDKRPDGSKRPWSEQRAILATKIPRPFKDLTDSQLLAEVKRENAEAGKSRREMGKRSRQLLKDISKVLTELKKREVPADDIATLLGVSAMTVSRYRREVT